MEAQNPTDGLLVAVYHYQGGLLLVTHCLGSSGFFVEGSCCLE